MLHKRRSQQTTVTFAWLMALVRAGPKRNVCFCLACTKCDLEQYPYREKHARIVRNFKCLARKTLGDETKKNKTK